MLFPLENVLYQCDSDYLAVHVQAQPQSKEIQCLLPATPNSQSTFGQQVLKPIAAPHMISACKSNTAKVPLEALQMEVEVPLEAVQMEVDKPEACRHLASPVVLKPEVCAFHFVGVSSLPSKWKCPILMCFWLSFCVCFQDKFFDRNVGSLLQLQVVAKPEACTGKTETVVAADCSKENIPAVHQNVQANVDASSLVELLTQKLSSISLGEATPNVASRSCREWGLDSMLLVVSDYPLVICRQLQLTSLIPLTYLWCKILVHRAL